MIHLSHVSKSYKTSTRPALDDVTLDVEKGEFVFLIGPSGSGKSTFMRLVLREDMATRGQVTVAGSDLNKMRSAKVPAHRRRLGCVFQDFRLLPNKTVQENVGFALEVIGRNRLTVKKIVPEVLELVGLEGKARRFPHELSGGEQQRVAIARAFVNRPLLLLADEPTGNLDPDTSADIMLLLERINRTGTTVLMATHDNHIVDSMRRRVVELQLGKVVRDESRGVYGVVADQRRSTRTLSITRSTAGRTGDRPVTAKGTHARRIRRQRGLHGHSPEPDHDDRDGPDHRDLAVSARRRLVLSREASHTRDLYESKIAVIVQLTLPESSADPNCTDTNCQAILKSLQANSEVQDVDYNSQAQAYQQYQQQYAGQPDMIAIARCRRSPPISGSGSTTRRTTRSSPPSTAASPG